MVEKKFKTLAITCQITIIPHQGHIKQVFQIIGVLGDLDPLKADHTQNLQFQTSNTDGIE